MKYILMKICYPSRCINCPLPLTKGEYPPPWKRISFNMDICESYFFQNYIYRFRIEKINMKWYPALGSIFSPNTHLETSTIWYTHLETSTFFKESMTFSQEIIRFIDMFEHMKSLYLLEISVLKRCILYCRKYEIFLRKYFFYIYNSFFIEIYTVYIPAIIIIWNKLESMITTDIKNFFVMRYRLIYESRSKHFCIWQNIDILILGSHLYEARSIRKIAHMTYITLYIVSFELTISFTTIMIMEQKSIFSRCADRTRTLHNIYYLGSSPRYLLKYFFCYIGIGKIFKTILTRRIYW